MFTFDVHQYGGQLKRGHVTENDLYERVGKSVSLESLYQTESFETARISLVNEPDKYGETRAVVHERTRRNQEMLFAYRAQQYKAFLCPIGSQKYNSFIVALTTK